MALHLTFNTIEKAEDANIQIFESYARTKTQVLRTATGEMVPVGGIAAGDLVSLIYVVAGVKSGATVTNGQGQTQKWANIHERADQIGTFFFVKPDASLMTGVVFDTEEEPATGWYPNDAISDETKGQLNSARAAANPNREVEIRNDGSVYFFENAAHQLKMQNQRIQFNLI